MELMPGQDFGYKFASWLQSVNEQVGRSSRIWFIVLAAVVLISWPAGYFLNSYLTKTFIAAYQPPAVIRPPEPRPLEVIRTEVLPTGQSGVYSAFAQIRNPNPDASARQITYHFAGQPDEQSYLPAGESRFLVLPAFAPTAVGAEEGEPAAGLIIDSVRWVRGTAPEVKFEVLQSTSGVNGEGQFFVEALIKNLRALRLRKVDVDVLVFDRRGQVTAVNTTEMTDLLPYESRYFRVLWPGLVPGAGQFEILPLVNPLEPGAVIDIESNLPVR